MLNEVNHRDWANSHYIQQGQQVQQFPSTGWKKVEYIDGNCPQAAHQGLGEDASSLVG